MQKVINLKEKGQFIEDVEILYKNLDFDESQRTHSTAQHTYDLGMHFNNILTKTKEITKIIQKSFNSFIIFI